MVPKWEQGVKRFGFALRYPTWDRAVGPAQFLPGSGRSFGQDANHDGTADPQNVFDAALATVAHLCLPSPGDYANSADLARALRCYNNSDEDVATVTRMDRLLPHLPVHPR